MSDPQRLASLPGRVPPKRLGRTPIIAGSAAVILLGLVPLGFVLRSVVQQQGSASASAADAAPGNPGDAIGSGGGHAHQDAPPDIKAETPPANRNGAATSAPASGGAQRQPDVHEQARLTAWQEYYRQIAEMQADRRRRALEAMRADPSAQPVAQEGRGSAPAAIGQAGPPAATPPALRPGELYQGPVDTAGLHLAAAPVAAVSPYELKRAVSIIPYRLDQDITTGAAGQFTATVSRHVTAYGRPDDILIPQGARLVAVYEDQTGAGDERMRVAITSIIYPATYNPRCPGGEELPLGSMPGADASGRAGFRDRVDRHTGRLIFNALIQAVGGAGTQLAQPRGRSNLYDPSSVLAAQAGLAGQSVLNQTVQRDLAVGATFETRAGYPAMLQLTKTIPFAEPWRPGFGFCGPVGAIQ